MYQSCPYFKLKIESDETELDPVFIIIAEVFAKMFI